MQAVRVRETDCSGCYWQLSMACLQGGDWGGRGWDGGEGTRGGGGGGSENRQP